MLDCSYLACKNILQTLMEDEDGDEVFEMEKKRSSPWTSKMKNSAVSFWVFSLVRVISGKINKSCLWDVCKSSWFCLVPSAQPSFISHSVLPEVKEMQTISGTKSLQCLHILGFSDTMNCWFSNVKLTMNTSQLCRIKRVIFLCFKPHFFVGIISNLVILKATDDLIIICDEHRILQDYKSICD